MNFIVWWLLRFDIFSKIFIVIVCVSIGDVINFEIYLSLLMKPFPYITGKFRTKMQMSWEKNKLLRWNKSIIHHFKELSLKKINPTFLEGDSPTLRTYCNFLKTPFSSKTDSHWRVALVLCSEEAQFLFWIF